MRLNKDEYTAFDPLTSYGGEDWMALNEVNVIAKDGAYIIYEFSVWVDGARRWSKNIINIEDGDIDKLTTAIILRVNSARNKADLFTEGE